MTRRVFLVDDHPLSRRGIRQVLEESEDLRVSGEAGNPDEALARLRITACDLLITDLSMPNGSGADLIRKWKALKPDGRALVLTMYSDWQLLEQSVEAGADGYALKSADPETLLAAVRRVLAGETVFPDPPRAFVGGDQDRERRKTLQGLSAREREVLQLVAEARMNREIAEQLKISVRTVESHRANIMQKLGARTSAELIRHAARLLD